MRKGQKASKELKRKMSESRKRYLAGLPEEDRVAWGRACREHQLETMSADEMRDLYKRAAVTRAKTIKSRKSGKSNAVN